MAKKKAPKRKKAARKKAASHTSTIDSFLEDLENDWENSRALETFSYQREWKPGIYTGIPFDEYCAIPAINNSSLGAAKKSLLHYRYATPNESTPSLRIGSFIHHGKLEPALIKSVYTVVPPFEKQVRREDGSEYATPKASKAYKELVADFKKQNPGKIFVPQEWMDNLNLILKALDGDKLTHDLFFQGVPEVTLIWTDPVTELMCKGRIDWLCPRGAVDLKTTEDCTEFNLAKWDYQRQAAFYSWGYTLAYQALKGGARNRFPLPGKEGLDFWFAVVEKSRPYGVRTAPISYQAQQAGHSEFRYLLDRIAEGKKNKRYPGPTNPKVWDLPPWYKPMSFTENYIEEPE